MCGGVKSKLPEFNFADEHIITMDNFERFCDRMREVNVAQVQEIPHRSLPDGFDVSLNENDEDLALMSKALMEMSVQRYF